MLAYFARKTLTTLFFFIWTVCVFAQSNKNHRVIVLSDIEADPDDSQSMIRLLLYSNVIDIKGLIATTSVWQRSRVAPESIRKIIQVYDKVQPNLIKHENGYPKAIDLMGKVKTGMAKYGMEGVGEGKDSEGSDWIIKILEENDVRPLWVSVWGGANTLAQALYKIEKTKTATETQKLIAKLRVYTISDQDDSGIWLRTKFPGLFYIVSPGDHYGSATWIAINSVIEGVNNETISNKWLAEHIQQGHGPLGAVYPDVTYGMEGDTPAWLSLIPNGLNNAENPDWGGWGGRYELYQPDAASLQKGSSGVPNQPETRKIWTDAIDQYTPYVYSNYGRTVKQDKGIFKDNKVSLWRWRDDFQNDFAARMDWCVKSYKEANHPPIPVLDQGEAITVRSGQGFNLEAGGSSDPDGDNLSFFWSHYPEAGTYKEIIKVNAENLHGVYILAPKVDKRETAHFILQLSDKGTPRLTRYKRIIVTIIP